MYFCTQNWGEVKKIQSKIINQSLYSLDMLTLEFIIPHSDVQRLMTMYSMRINFTQWESKKLSVCRYNYSVECENENSFYIGFSPNWKKSEHGFVSGRVEFNPSKLADDLTFISSYQELLSYVPFGFAKPVKFDLAIDIPVARDKIHLIKDKRTYEEYSNSNSDRTQYLGKRNSHGRVKVYNKALEQKIDIDLTRIELTIDYDKRSIDEIKKILPSLYLLDSFQFPLGIVGTDKVILVAILSDLSLMRELGRKKQDKIKAYLADMQLNLTLDIDKYNKVLENIQGYIK